MPDYEFHITVQPYVDRVFVHRAVRGEENTVQLGAQICEMMLLDSGNASEKIFNGTIPESQQTGAMFIMRFLSSEGVLELPAGKALSIPLTDTDSWQPGEQNNFIVFNDIPGEGTVCLVEFTPRFARMLSTPAIIELQRKERGQLKKEWNAKNSDLLARGVDPVAQNFISPVVLKPEEYGVMEALCELEDEIITFKLYGVELFRTFSIDQ